MPTYEYTCSSCGSDHEVVQSMADPSLTVCPDCGAEGLRKVFSGVGIHFKGSGFYRTDSRDAKTSSSTSTSTTPAPAPSKESTSSSGSSKSGASTSASPAPAST